MTPHPRLPLAPLLKLITPTIRGRGSRWTNGCELEARAVADFLGVDRSVFWRWQKAGAISERTADRIACELGLHPALIWGDDWERLMNVPLDEIEDLDDSPLTAPTRSA